ncbi:MAG TPA: DUF302 domain-containing protein [Gammaproteobacteria bacterium]|nr:DUF302 domain-containing protein [Gammaproteobacteria bacterium]
MNNNRIKSLSLSLLFLTVALGSNIASAHPDGIIRIKSHNSVTVTIDKLQQALSKKGMTIFKRIDHAAGGEKVGIDIRPTELLIFGNPKIGTKLMQCTQEAALDLPQKALAYRDKSGQVWLIYNNPHYMADRHHVEGCEKVINKFSNALAHFTKIAAE